MIGGGSEHLPAFMGYVGTGGAHAAPVGTIFASPPAKPTLEATLPANGGAGVIYSYGNYAGDVMDLTAPRPAPPNSASPSGPCS